MFRFSILDEVRITSQQAFIFVPLMVILKTYFSCFTLTILGFWLIFFFCQSILEMSKMSFVGRLLAIQCELLRLLFSIARQHTKRVLYNIFVLKMVKWKQLLARSSAMLRNGVVDITDTVVASIRVLCINIRTINLENSLFLNEYLTNGIFNHFSVLWCTVSM